MPFNTTPIAVDYSTEELRILGEEYLSMQKKEFTLKGVCSHVLYWAMEEGRTAGAGTVRAGNAGNAGAGKTLYEGNQLEAGDCERIGRILESIVKDGRISKIAGDETRYLKQ